MTNTTERLWNNRAARKVGAGLLGVLAAANMAAAGAAVPNAGARPNEISFDLVPNPQTLECLRANYNEEPRAHATVVRGKLNDTLILDLDGIKPGLQFDLFTVQHSPFLANGTKDPAFTGSFGLAWYQSDIEIPKNSDRGHVRISTILLDQIFGFDPDVKLPPTNTFHLGFWFNNPEDAAPAPCNFNPAKPTPFNGEHKAGPFAMISLPEPASHLGPLCTDPNLSTKPASCDP
jgi:hypothetical protein